MPPFTPEIGAALAKILADLGGAFAVDNPVQQGIAQTLSSGATGLIKSQQFNRSQDELSSSLLSIVNQGQENVPLEPLRLGGPTIRSGTGDRGIGNGSAGNRTLGDLGLTDASRIDPFAAFALGGQGVEDAIRTKQQERFRVEKALERETDFKQRIQVIKLQRQNQRDLEEFRMELQEVRDIARGGPQQRAANLRSTRAGAVSTEAATARQPSIKTAADERERKALALDRSSEGQRLRNRQDILDFESAATPQEAQALRTAQLGQAEAREDIAASDAAIRDELNEAQLRVAQLKAERTPGELATIQRTVRNQVSPGIMRFLRKKFATSPDKLKAMLNLFGKVSDDQLDETGRRTAFTSLISLLTIEELKPFQNQLDAVGAALLKGDRASTAVKIGTIPPLFETPLTPVELDPFINSEDDILSGQR